ncbi:unnamed protein product [Cylindrotheca closterium]|uniref:RRM domain-containing protein n=1 Tax=Cylindrotheca closterium TaxID=2856 RepID=A0AAD2GD06_9STRA|nr:unnamed protein product [Cylindrotheca closterium]
MTVERIYIGGLDPPRLSGKDIVSRLKSLDGIELQSIVDKEKCFIHLTATSSSQDQSALAIISQKYNNVKWKGCRLEVAEAKPSFLQRLELERQERAEREAQEKESTTAVEDTPSKEDEAEGQAPSRIPRRLRIRKKFGDEAVHVDTRPFSVDNWKNFHAAKKKLLQRADNHAQKAKKIREMKHTAYVHAPLEHRAVHIRFASSSDSNNHAPTERHAVSSSEEYEASGSENEDDDESVDSVSSDEESGDEPSASKEAKATKPGSYDWSDDDSDSDSSSDEKSAADEMAPPEPQQAAVVVESIEEPKQPDAPKAGYEWSSDSSSDESSVHIKRTQTFQDVAVDDEFAAGLDDAKWNDSEEEDYVPASEKNANDAAYQMDNDLSANLGVLTDLFPDMKDKSHPKEDNDEDAKQQHEQDSRSITKPPMPFGIMPRYDPTAVASQKYEVKEQEPSEDEGSSEEEEEVPMKGAENSDSEEESASDDDDEKEKDGDNDNKEEKEEEDKTPIYQEGKLENVFREARDAWQVQSTLTAQKKEESSSTGAFSFGFDLGSPEPTTEKNKNDGGFSFGFSLPPDTASEGKEASKQLAKDSNEADGTSEDKMDVEDSDDQPAPDSNTKRRRGLRFSEAEMQSYEADFFSHNYGEDIIENLQGFRNHQEDREQWLRERQSLTLDWKRKRKLAMSRIQKRIRHK